MLLNMYLQHISNPSMECIMMGACFGSHCFASGVRVLDRIVLILKNGDLVISSVFEQLNQNLKKQVEKLRSFEDVSEFRGEWVSEGSYRV